MGKSGTERGSGEFGRPGPRLRGGAGSSSAGPDRQPPRGRAVSEGKTSGSGASTAASRCTPAAATSAVASCRRPARCSPAMDTQAPRSTRSSPQRLPNLLLPLLRQQGGVHPGGLHGGDERPRRRPLPKRLGRRSPGNESGWRCGGSSPASPPTPRRRGWRSWSPPGSVRGSSRHGSRRGRASRICSPLSCGAPPAGGTAPRPSRAHRAGDAGGGCRVGRRPRGRQARREPGRRSSSR
jgi:hypothetical protein